ncbi:hypothetical protein J6253_01645 [bacterium]|jgi:hypothetical protein|nr:hypothetical protein [bacterium]MBP5592298.1 hypothetical protein [bacterium]
MIRKESEERQIIWWNLITMLAMIGFSFALINAEEGTLFYVIAAVLFLCVGIFVKRPYVFFSIMLVVIVLWAAKEALFSILLDETDTIFNFDFFINSNK